MRDYAYYLDKAKEKQGFKTDLEINQALGFKGSIASMLRKNKMNLSDDKMLELAKLAGESPLIALIDLNIMRSNGDAKKSYEKIYKGIEKTITTLSLAGLLAILPEIAEAATHTQILTSSIKGLVLAPIYIITLFEPNSLA